MYRLYVIELNKKVFTEHRRFREANPQFNGVLECLYVGMTSKSPKERFEQHKRRQLSKKGVDISSYIVWKYGTFLRPSLYHGLPEFNSLAEALRAEQALAARLRKLRYAVWVN
ncbi:MAG: ribose-5-phosphate isomerase [Saprospiraceae bacterium]|nr:ribose-5-phosphate isomerase [Saprospiraceae bacterium]